LYPTFVPAANGGFEVNGNHRDWNTLPPSIPPFADAPSPGSSLPGLSLEDELESLRREKLDLHNQLFEAAQIQRKLSGPRLLRHGDLQFASEVFAAHFLSGDFITFSKSGSRVFTAHGDIAGKGIAAGMWFTNLAGLLQCYARPDSDPANIASEVNRHLCYLRPVAPFVTGVIAQVDCERGELTYCNAGHFPPLLLHADGSADLLQEGGPLLGAIDGAEFCSATLLLAPGDTLVTYSDGVLECANPGGEEFGTDRLLETLRCAEGQSAHTKLMIVLAALQDFANGTPLRDDVSLTVIQRDAGAQ
jgi:serine phosphatase RsbU (regulator of sigma subunit)